MEQVMLDYEIIGQAGPIIVFENGLGGHYHDWRLVVNAIASQATAVMYNRAGYGYSKSSDGLRTTEHIAKELKLMLEEIGVEKEIILVGHSFGGLCVQHFASLYPEMVKAVVLVDSTSANFNRLYALDLPVLFQHITIDKMIERWNNLAAKTSSELKAMMQPILSEDQQKLPQELHEELEQFSTDPRTYGTMSAEVENWGVSSSLIKSSKDFPDIPLCVIARDSEKSVKFYMDRGIPQEEAEAYEAVWRELQVEHSKLSKQGKLIVAHGSDHNIQLEKPDVLINCIKEWI